MESRLKLAAASLAAFAGTGAALFFGTGLDPLPWLTWIAPLPVLLVAPRLRWWSAAVVAFAAWLVGELNEWSYLTGQIEMPPVRAALIYLAAALLFAMVVLLYRALVHRGRWWAATLALPVTWVGFEYLFSVASPDGAFWSLAYTQSDVLPVIQVAAVTGYLGITFVVLLVPSVVAVALTRGVGRVTRLRLTGAASVLLLAVLGYGLVQLGRGPVAGPTTRIVLISQTGDGDHVDVTTPAGQSRLAGYLTQTRTAIDRGARIVVLPEMVFTTEAPTLSTIDGPFSTLAATTGATIVLGVGQLDPSFGIVNGQRSGYNTAQLFAPDGSVTTYRKQHLLFTEPYRPGTTLAYTTAPGPTAGVAICKDLDFPGLIRSYRSGGAQLMLVPAWDSDDDAWLHSRMSVLRGVENGIPIARTARMGALTISDAQGRIVAEARTDGTGFVTTTADVRIAGQSTVYTIAGPWFAWLGLALTAGTLLRLRRRRHPVDGAPAERGELVAIH